MSVSSIINFGVGIALKVSTNASPSSIVVSSLDSDHSFQLVEILTIDRNSSKDRAVDAVITRRFKRNSGSRRQVCKHVDHSGSGADQAQVGRSKRRA